MNSNTSKTLTGRTASLEVEQQNLLNPKVKRVPAPAPVEIADFNFASAEVRAMSWLFVLKS